VRLIRGKTGADLNSVRPAPKEITIPFLDKLMTPRVGTKDISIFVRQFATMIDAGLPLVQCLEILGNQQDNPTLGNLIKKLRSDVEEGSTFADALRKHPRYFDNLFVNLVDAGETGGILDTILIGQRLDFRILAKVLDMPIQQIREYNPQYKRDIIPQSFSNGLNTLRIPIEKSAVYYAKKDLIYKYQPSAYRFVTSRER